jgi:hypothetical protein
VAVELKGTSASGVPARVSLYYRPRVANHQWTEEMNSSLVSLLNMAASSGLVNNPDYITEEELAKLGREGKLAFPEDMFPEYTPLNDPVIGEPCTPGEALDQATSARQATAGRSCLERSSTPRRVTSFFVRRAMGWSVRC